MADEQIQGGDGLGSLSIRLGADTSSLENDLNSVYQFSQKIAESIASELFSSLNKAGQGADQLGQAINDSLSAASSAGGGRQGQVIGQGLIQSAISGIQQNAPKLGDALAGAVNGAGGNGGSSGAGKAVADQFLQETLTSLRAGADEIQGNIFYAFNNSVDDGSKAGQELGRKFVEETLAAIESGSDEIQLSVFDSLNTSNLPDLGASINDAAAGTGQTGSRIGQSIVDSLQSSLRAGVDRVASILPEGLRSSIGGLANTGREIGQSLISSATNSLQAGSRRLNDIIPDSMRQSVGSVARLGTEIGQSLIQGALGAVSSGAGRIGGALSSGFKGAMGSIGQGIGFGAGMTLVDLALKPITIPISVTGDAVGTFVDLERSVNAFQAKAGATEEEAEALADAAKRLGADTSKSATEVAALGVELATLGFDGQGAVDVLDGVVSASEATGDGLSEVGSLIAGAINSFSELERTTEDSQRAADLFAEAMNRSALDTSKLTVGLATVGSTASAFNQSLATTTTVLGLLADQNVRAETAGTAFKILLSSLAAPSGTAQEALDALAKANGGVAIQLRDSEGRLRDFIEILPELRTAFNALPKDQLEGVAEGLAGREGMQALLSLINRPQEDVENLYSSLMDSQGAAKGAQEILLSGVGGALDLLDSSLESLKLGFGEAFGPALEEGAKFLASIVDELLETNGLFDNLSTLSQDFADYLSENPELASETAEIISTFIVGGLEKVRDLGQQILTAFRENPDALNDWMQNATNLALAIGSAADGALRLIALFGELGRRRDAFNKIGRGDDQLGLEETKLAFTDPVQYITNARQRNREYINENGREFLNVFGIEPPEREEEEPTAQPRSQDAQPRRRALGNDLSQKLRKASQPAVDVPEEIDAPAINSEPFENSVAEILGKADEYKQAMSNIDQEQQESDVALAEAFASDSNTMSPDDFQDRMLQSDLEFLEKRIAQANARKAELDEALAIEPGNTDVIEELAEVEEQILKARNDRAQKMAQQRADIEKEALEAVLQRAREAEAAIRQSATERTNAILQSQLSGDGPDAPTAELQIGQIELESRQEVIDARREELAEIRQLREAEGTLTEELAQREMQLVTEIGELTTQRLREEIELRRAAAEESIRSQYEPEMLEQDQQAFNIDTDRQLLDSQSNLESSLNQLQIERLNTRIALAQAAGDEAGAMQLQMQLSRVQQANLSQEFQLRKRQLDLEIQLQQVEDRQRITQARMNLELAQANNASSRELQRLREIVSQEERRAQINEQLNGERVRGLDIERQIAEEQLKQSSITQPGSEEGSSSQSEEERTQLLQQRASSVSSALGGYNAEERPDRTEVSQNLQSLSQNAGLAYQAGILSANEYAQFQGAIAQGQGLVNNASDSTIINQVANAGNPYLEDILSQTGLGDLTAIAGLKLEEDEATKLEAALVGTEEKLTNVETAVKDGLTSLQSTLSPENFAGAFKEANAGVISAINKLGAVQGSSVVNNYGEAANGCNTATQAVAAQANASRRRAKI